MLHILFLILKIIGIILLAILGIAVALVCIVLFVPIRYRLKAETTNGLSGLLLEFKATWLFHLVSAYAIYKETELEWKARIAWKKLGGDDELPDEEEFEDVTDDIVEDIVENVETVKEKTDTQKIPQETSQETSKQRESDRKESPDKRKKRKETKKQKKHEKTSWLDKIKCTIKGICDKIKNIKEFITDETHILAVVHLKDELVYFLKKIKPDKIKGYFRFGLEDPYNTGQILALLSILYPFYGENVEIYPEFEKEILEGDIFMKGRIHLIHLMIPICKLYFDDNIKVAYHNFKSLK